ncbi:unnamed protein product [Staurois parvus]|uniref:SH2 domain-containing protein n=1 Tax=Staurois parvus TaxID=386267 RepID=A0ABN9EZL2_9NEOB|nr:unnamed protein product [Staurois parvus]
MPEGFFLVRDSTHPSYLFTLSVRTNRGPTNVRIEYSDSLFRLDSNWLSKPRILSFPDVVSLVQHYVSSCSSDGPKEPASQPPPEPSPLKEPAAVHLKLLQPLHEPKRREPELAAPVPAADQPEHGARHGGDGAAAAAQDGGVPTEVPIQALMVFRDGLHFFFSPTHTSHTWTVNIPDIYYEWPHTRRLFLALIAAQR